MAYSITYVQTPTSDPQKPDIKVFTVNLGRIGFNSCDYYSHEIDIDPTQEYIFAIDQSLTSTGIALATLDFSFVVIFTVVIDSVSVTARQEYVNVILEFIRGLLEGKQLRFRSLEAVPPSKYSRTRLKLDPLKGAIETGLDRFPAIRNLEADYKFSIYPASWKSTVYDKRNKRKDGFNDKAVIAGDIVKMYPFLEPYFKELQSTRGHDYDGFDAFGILIHTRLAHFTPEWDLKNKSAKYQLGRFNVLFAYLTDYEAIEEKKLMGPLAPWAAYGNLDIRTWNQDESIFYNLLMAANTDKVICMECKSLKQIFAFLIEFNVPYDKNRVLYTIVGKAGRNQLNPSQVARLEKQGFYSKVYYKE